MAAQDHIPIIANPMAHRLSSGRPQIENLSSTPRQSPVSGFKAINAIQQVQGNLPPLAPLGSPTLLSDNKIRGVLLGYWKESSEPRPEDKHAVYGVLGSGDSFRVKVQRVTRDGRHVDGNFPVGAGAMWINYNALVLEPQLMGMSRGEIKEYVRIRQRDIEGLESENNRRANEQKAIREAKEVVAESNHDSKIVSDIEVRYSARSEQRTTARQQAEADAMAERSRREKTEARERQNEITRREVALAEANLHEAAQVQEAAQTEFRNNLKRLNKVWVAQKAATTPGASARTSPAAVPLPTPPANFPTPAANAPVANESAANMPAPPPKRAWAPNEVKYHDGIKYEVKEYGPFQGKMASEARLIQIDGKDYVEYRILGKIMDF